MRMVGLRVWQFLTAKLFYDRQVSHLFVILVLSPTTKVFQMQVYRLRSLRPLQHYFPSSNHRLDRIPVGCRGDKVLACICGM